jgi:hypothetical protein
MSRGPLRLRVETLRQLAQADPDNRVWDEDLRVFEEERLKEIQQEAARTIAAGDAAALAGLAAEVAAGPWRVPPPAQLVHEIAAARASLARRDGLAEMACVQEHLNATHAALDVDAGRRLREQWNQLNAAWGPYANGEWPDCIAPALQWLTEQDDLDQREARHAAALAVLDEAIVARKPLEELARLHRLAGREGDVPPAVEIRYRAHLAARERAIRREARLALAAIALVVLVIGALVAGRPAGCDASRSPAGLPAAAASRCAGRPAGIRPGGRRRGPGRVALATCRGGSSVDRGPRGYAGAAAATGRISSIPIDREGPAAGGRGGTLQRPPGLGGRGGPGGAIGPR